MVKIALVTDSVNPKLNRSDAKLVPEFKHAGYEAVGVPWDEIGLEWEEYETVILRSCWNYHEHYDQFVEWINGMKAKGIAVWNPVEIVKTNTHKAYLLDLEIKGVSIVPTVLINPEDPLSIDTILQTNDWEEIVIKPAVGCYGKNVDRFTREQRQEAQEDLESKLEWGGVIVQPLMQSVTESGEYSLVFVNKTFSHAMVKLPKKGGFITSGKHRGSEKRIEVDPDMVEQADRALQVIGSPLLYARVDGVVENGTFYLMELELTEPYLFFEYDKNAAKRVVEAYVSLAEQ
jgi:glutathione synthase/RimK-type ligase-like ATP-grasp enzyme